MYTMKNISKYLGAGLLLLATACSQTQEGTYYTPNKDDAKAIHFIQSSIEKEFAQDVRDGVIDVEIARPGDKGAYTVYLTTKGVNDDIFTIPTEVTIPDGKHAVTIQVGVNLSKFVMGSSYKTTLYISDREALPGNNSAQVAQYSDKVTLSASFELEWETFYRTTESGETIPQLATYHYNGYYTGRDSGLEVEKAVGANIYRLKDWASGVTFKFIVHDDDTCTVPAQSIGYYNSNYNEYVYVADMAVYTGNDAAYSSYPCTFDKNTNTYSFYLIYYVSSGYFAQGKETLVFDSDLDTTPVVNIEFKGVETTSTGFKAPKLYFSPNSYTKFYKAAVIAGDITNNSTRQEQVRQLLIDDKLEAVTPVVKLYDTDESVWSVPKGNYTAVALAYDSVENPCKLYTQRFTCDLTGEYDIKVDEFEWYSSDNNPNYSPYTTLYWDMKVRNIVSMKYLCMATPIMEYLCEYYGQTLEELTMEMGREMPEETIEQMLSDEGRKGVFNTLDEGTDYTLALVMANSFGDTKFVSKAATTFGHFSKDFDQTKNFEDFIGAFNATATVSVSGGSGKTTAKYRIDITRVNDSEVIINGTSDMRDFTPELGAYYDKQKHMLIVEPQSAGTYNRNYAMFTLTDGMSYYWGSGSLAIGYIGDTLYWSASPYAGSNVYGYLFALFSSPVATSSSYLREYVGSKTYSFVSMTPLKMAPAATVSAKVAAPGQANFATIQAGDKTLRLELMSSDVITPAAKAVRETTPTRTPAAEGKRMRTDLVLRTL